MAVARGRPPGGLDEWSRRNAPALAALEAEWAGAAAGETLLHCDVRADNVLLAGSRAWVVDWPWASRGAAWVDVAFMAPSVRLQGGPAPDELLARYPGVRPDPRSLAPVVAAVAGYFTAAALRPPPPGLPTLRAYQDAQGVVAREWLAGLTGLA